jgi:single-strand DNA-binding protein
MSGINKVIILGRLGVDPEIRRTESGIPVASCSIATSKKWTDKQSGELMERTEWHRITAWNNLAEVLEKYVKKGDQIYIEGELQTQSYDKDGTTMYVTQIVANKVELLSNKPSGGVPHPAETQQAPQQDLPDAKDDLPF